MESIAGMQTGLNQSNAIMGQDSALFQSIAQLNNDNITTFNNNLDKMETKDTGIEHDNLNKMVSYAGGVGEKVNELKDFVKEGKNIGDLKSYKAITGAGPGLSKVGSIISSGVKSARSGGFEPGLLYEESEGDTNPSADVTRANIRQRTGGEGPDEEATTLEGDIDTNTQPDHFGAEEPPANVEAPAGSVTEQATEGGADALKTAGKTAEEGAEGVAQIGKIAGGIARVGGAVFSAGMLGDDIYNQVKDKSFFAGDNTGDKIGNFLNEAGSIADLGGIATADPLLVLAGVGLGAVGSVVSDISDLFGHHSKEEDAGKKTPAPITAPASQNIGGTGGIANTSLSTLRTVQAGGS